jgi:hypothetical protein
MVAAKKFHQGLDLKRPIELQFPLTTLERLWRCSSFIFLSLRL